MKALGALQSFVDAHPVAYAVVGPGPASGATACIRPSDAVYYPLYTKCCELDLPLCVNTGIPGPPLPAEAQNPIHLDRVCIRFPELRLCMIHGADPWWDTAIRLMIKYRNLRLMTTAWSPKYLPESLLHYLRTRGKDRILFASDYPVLSMERCLGEAKALDLPEEVLDAWLYANAEALLLRHRWRRKHLEQLRWPVHERGLTDMAKTTPHGTIARPAAPREKPQQSLTSCDARSCPASSTRATSSGTSRS